VHVVALFLDATFVSVRPTGAKEGVLVAWGLTEAGERVLLAVTLGMRGSYEDWQALGRDLIARGLGAPMLIVADGRLGVDQSHRAVLAGLRPSALLCAQGAQLYAKLPERERVKHAHWQAICSSPTGPTASTSPSSTPTTPPGQIQRTR
jgi:hypothetical protein